jgi:hypothetical protein
MFNGMEEDGVQDLNRRVKGRKCTGPNSTTIKHHIQFILTGLQKVSFELFVYLLCSKKKIYSSSPLSTQLIAHHLP